MIPVLQLAFDNGNEVGRGCESSTGRSSFISELSVLLGRSLRPRNTYSAIFVLLTAAVYASMLAELGGLTLASPVDEKLWFTKRDSQYLACHGRWMALTCSR